MDPILYNAAMEGNLDVLSQNKDQLEVQLTPNNNTILHVAAQFHDSGDFAKGILEMHPSLLCRVNSTGDTALHIAARKGHSNTVKELIACAKTQGNDLESIVRITKEMLRMTNGDKDTALHEAVRYNRLAVVELLIQEDPKFPHVANNSDETPLHLAAERDYHEIVSRILKSCTSPDHRGPNGRTALHAAVFSGCGVCGRELIYWKPSLTKEADLDGWTPLHCAARLNFVQCARQLLTHCPDKSKVYIPANKDDNKTALHLAASEGHVDIMKELLSHCPDCWEIVNSKGQNILHIAVDYEKEKVIDFILENSWFSNLVNQKDNDGNTPLHLYVASDGLIANNLIAHQEADKGAFNKKNMTLINMAESIGSRLNEDEIKGQLKKVKAPRGWRNIVSEDCDRTTNWKKARADNQLFDVKHFDQVNQNHMLVATLIATVNFAAGFTLPGGYNSNDGPNEGMAVLVRQAAFKAFVVSNTTALIFSMFALFTFLFGSFYRCQNMVVFLAGGGMSFMFIAIGAMTIAFITGTYAVLANSSSLAIAVCVIGCFSFIIYYDLLCKLIRDVFDLCSTLVAT